MPWMCLQWTMTRRLGELKITSKIRAKEWTENPKPDSGKGTSLREREGANTVIYLTVFPRTSFQLVDKCSLKTFWGKNCIMIIISMASFKHIIIAGHLYICSLNLFKFLLLLAQLESCIVEKGVISFFKPLALSVFCCKTWSLLALFFAIWEPWFAQPPSPEQLFQEFQH